MNYTLNARKKQSYFKCSRSRTNYRNCRSPSWRADFLIPSKKTSKPLWSVSKATTSTKSLSKSISKTWIITVSWPQNTRSRRNKCNKISVAPNRQFSWIPLPLTHSVRTSSLHLAPKISRHQTAPLCPHKTKIASPTNYRQRPRWRMN